MTPQSATLQPHGDDPCSQPERTREDWLLAVARELVPKFADRGYPITKPIRISVGWASKGGAKGKAIGECWTADASADGVHEIFVTPKIGDSFRQADTLLHEMCHVVAGIKAKHGKAFKQVAVAMGLQGKMTATEAGPEATIMLEAILARVGPMPHAALDPSKIITSGPKKQTTRMIKCECQSCGYVCRVAKKWLAIGPPVCPQDDLAMVAEEPEEPEGDGE